MVTLCLCVTMCPERLHGHAIQRDHATPQLTGHRALGALGTPASLDPAAPVAGSNAWAGTLCL